MLRALELAPRFQRAQELLLRLHATGGGRRMKAWALLLALFAGGATAARHRPARGVRYENTPYNGRFTFVRIRFEPSRWGPGNYMWGLDLKWNHDYPRAETHFMKILKELTTLDLNPAGGNILALDDPELFNYPVAYLCELGFWTLDDEESPASAPTFSRGVPDRGRLRGPAVGQLRGADAAGAARRPPGRAGPDAPRLRLLLPRGPTRLPPPLLPRRAPRFLGVFEDNDPGKRLMVVVNYNQDLSEYWEWSDTGFVPIDLTNEAYKLGVDYVIYGMTH